MAVPKQVRKQTEAVQALYNDLNDEGTTSPQGEALLLQNSLHKNLHQPTVLTILYLSLNLLSRVKATKKTLNRNGRLFRVCILLILRG